MHQAVLKHAEKLSSGLLATWPCVHLHASILVEEALKSGKASGCSNERANSGMQFSISSNFFL